MCDPETPLDIYRHDLLGMRTSDWHLLDRPEREDDSKPVRLNQKERLITLILCLGFLYAVGIGVWKVQRTVFPVNVAEVRSIVFISSNQETKDILQIDKSPLLSTFVTDYFHRDDYWDWSTSKAVFSEIDDNLDRFIDQQAQEKVWIYPPPNWGLLNYVPPGQLVAYRCGLPFAGTCMSYW